MQLSVADLIVRPPTRSTRSTRTSEWHPRRSTPTAIQRATSWRDSTLACPDFDLSQIRCVYRDGQLVGGCIVHSRDGSALAPRGYRPAASAPSPRIPSIGKQGIASSAPRRRPRAGARRRRRAPAARRHPRLLPSLRLRRRLRRRLAPGGAPGRARPPAEPLLGPAGDEGRRATAARPLRPALRPLPRQLRAEPRPTAARAPGGRRSGARRSWPSRPTARLRGYLAFTWEHSGARAGEVGADDWPAVVALLQAHAGRSPSQPEAPEELLWPLPVTSPTFHLLADNLPLRTEVKRQPRADWQARVADGDTLLRQPRPALARELGRGAGRLAGEGWRSGWATRARSRSTSGPARWTWPRRARDPTRGRPRARRVPQGAVRRAGPRLGGGAAGSDVPAACCRRCRGSSRAPPGLDPRDRPF